jgi:LysR family hydrogen peroxide-inducible transcriptional activator
MRKFLNFQNFPSCESYIGFLAKSVKTIISINSIDFSDGARSWDSMLNISVRQLHYFMAVVKAGSFSRAAEIVGVTQSTLSAAIQALETEIGATLIDRSGRRMQLLPAGEDFLERARMIVALIEELPEHARQAERPLTTRLRMGVIPSIAPFLLPKVLPATTKAFPELQLTIREGLTRSLLDSLRSGSLDVALVAHPYDLDEFEVSKLGQDVFYLAVRRDHALANRDRIDADDLQDQPFLLLETGHCLREHVMAAIGSTPAQASGDVHATSITTLVQLVDFGMGVTLLPEIAVKSGVTRGTELSVVPYEGKNNYRSLVLVWRSNAARRNEFELFADHLRHKCMNQS